MLRVQCIIRVLYAMDFPNTNQKNVQYTTTSMRCLISRAHNKIFHKIQAVGIKCVTSHMSEKLQFGHILCQDGI